MAPAGATMEGGGGEKQYSVVQPLGGHHEEFRLENPSSAPLRVFHRLERMSEISTNRSNNLMAQMRGFQHDLEQTPAK
jgi:hypothetical protein